MITEDEEEISPKGLFEITSAKPKQVIEYFEFFYPELRKVIHGN